MALALPTLAYGRVLGVSDAATYVTVNGAEVAVGHAFALGASTTVLLVGSTASTAAVRITRNGAPQAGPVIQIQVARPTGLPSITTPPAFYKGPYGFGSVACAASPASYCVYQGAVLATGAALPFQAGAVFDLVGAGATFVASQGALGAPPISLYLSAGGPAPPVVTASAFFQSGSTLTAILVGCNIGVTGAATSLNYQLLAGGVQVRTGSIAPVTATTNAQPYLYGTTAIPPVGGIFVTNNSAVVVTATAVTGLPSAVSTYAALGKSAPPIAGTATSAIPIYASTSASTALSAFTVALTLAASAAANVVLYVIKNFATGTITFSCPGTVPTTLVCTGVLDNTWHALTLTNVSFSAGTPVVFAVSFASTAAAGEVIFAPLVVNTIGFTTPQLDALPTTTSPQYSLPIQYVLTAVGSGGTVVQPSNTLVTAAPPPPNPSGAVYAMTFPGPTGEMAQPTSSWAASNYVASTSSFTFQQASSVTGTYPNWVLVSPTTLASGSMAGLADPYVYGGGTTDNDYYQFSLSLVNSIGVTVAVAGVVNQAPTVGLTVPVMTFAGTYQTTAVPSATWTATECNNVSWALWVSATNSVYPTGYSLVAGSSGSASPGAGAGSASFSGATTPLYYYTWVVTATDGVDPVTQHSVPAQPTGIGPATVTITSATINLATGVFTVNWSGTNETGYTTALYNPSGVIHTGSFGVAPTGVDSFTLTALDSYYWIVTATQGAGGASVSATSSTQTLAAPTVTPGTLTLGSPGTTSSTITVPWTQTGGSTMSIAVYQGTSSSNVFSGSLLGTQTGIASTSNTWTSTASQFAFVNLDWVGVTLTNSATSVPFTASANSATIENYNPVPPATVTITSFVLTGVGANASATLDFTSTYATSFNVTLFQGTTSSNVFSGAVIINIPTLTSSATSYTYSAGGLTFTDWLGFEIIANQSGGTPSSPQYSSATQNGTPSGITVSVAGATPTVSADGSMTYVQFLSTSGTNTFQVTANPSSLNFTYALIGGGGSGGYEVGGGGGAGGYLNGTASLTTSTTYTAVVGAGGSITTGPGYVGAGSSTFNGLTAYGGGVGGDHFSNDGGTGGCGGGGVATGGLGIAFQGYAGGGNVSGNNRSAGGGGGVGGVGSPATTVLVAGNGGIGTTLVIGGTSFSFGGGGGGNAFPNSGTTTTPGSASYGGGAGAPYPGTNPAAGTPGTNGTGGGGGGALVVYGFTAAGGGSGFVLLAWPS